MSVATRLTLGFVLCALLMGTFASFAAAFREFQIQLDRLTHAATSQLAGRPDLAFRIYRQQAQPLEEALSGFLLSPEVASAIVYSSLGDKLAEVRREGGRSLASAPFDRVRGNALTVDRTLVTLSDSGERLAPGLVSSLFSPSSPIYYSQPVLSLVNPGPSGLTASDFAMALASGERSQTQWVIGYLHLLIDRGAIVASAVSASTRVFLYILVLVALCGIASWYTTRRVTRPLHQLTELADQLASGRLQGPVQVEGTPEMQEFAQVINSFLGGIENFRHERDVDKRLLSLKVEERNTQLDQRRRELDEAVQEVEHTRSRLQRMANYDPLTQLPNRQLFTEKLDLLLKLNQRNRHTLALLFIDLDDFKRINDSLGMSTGDRLLQEVAHRLRQTVRDSDGLGHFANSADDITVSRLGGDEFTVILNNVQDAETAAAVAHRLVDTLARPVDLDGHELIISTGVGVAMAPADAVEVEPLLRAAGIAKQHAKHSDRAGAVCFYNRDMAEAGQTRMRLETDLRKAIERGELSLHYQPQIDSHSGSVVGAEALLRWNHPELGPVSPGDFVHLAEEIGYMDTLGDWVLVEACRQLAAFNEREARLPRVAINVSAAQFDSRFVNRVGEVLREYGVRPSQLELGLSEAIMSDRNPDTVAALQTLSDGGVYLSVDDFGTGYSPISYLGQLPLDELKLHRSLLQAASRSENGAKLVAGIIAMATSLGLKVLATGVETAAQFRFLTENGATLVQGYLFSAPVPAEELEAMLSPWHFVDDLQKLATGPGVEMA